MAAFIDKRPAKFKNKYAASLAASGADYFLTQITRVTDAFGSLDAGGAGRRRDVIGLEES